MDWLTFISKLAEAIAWPAVLVGVLIWLRGPLADLVAALRSAKYKGLEFSFDKKLGELEVKADKASLPDPGVKPTWVSESPDDWTFGDYIERLAPISPRAAISEAWRHVELALKAAGKQSGKQPPRRLLEVARQLYEEGRIPRDAVGLLDDLRALRNQAVHADDMQIDPQQAIEFGRLAERLIASITLAEERDHSRTAG